MQQVFLIRLRKRNKCLYNFVIRVSLTIVMDQRYFDVGVLFLYHGDEIVVSTCFVRALL